VTAPETSRNTLELLFADLIKAQKDSASARFSPAQWNPKKSGEMDLLIDREGRWIHEGREIRRTKLVKLFSTILIREKDKYYLVSPVEKWQIKVAIAPFYIVNATREIRHNQQAISLTTSTEEIIVLSRDNPLIMGKNLPGEEAIPLVKVRNNLMGFLSRPIYYQLVDWSSIQLSPQGRENLVLHSMGENFNMGQITED
jgi:hypothetical protein